jgi:hypothetical protein
MQPSFIDNTNVAAEGTCEKRETLAEFDVSTKVTHLKKCNLFNNNFC